MEGALEPGEKGPNFPYDYVPKEWVPVGKNNNMAIPELRDRQFLQTMVNEGFYHHQIAEFLGTTQSNVSQWCRKLNVDPNPDLPPHPNMCVDPRLDDVDWLTEQYTGIGRTTISIAKELGCANQTVINRLDSFCIRRRSRDINVPIDEWIVLDPEVKEDRREGPVTPRVVALYAAEYYSVNVDELLSREGSTRSRIWHARRVVQWYCRQVLKMSNNHVAEVWGGLPAGTSRSYRRIETHIKSCPAYAREIQYLVQQIQERK